MESSTPVRRQEAVGLLPVGCLLLPSPLLPATAVAASVCLILSEHLHTRQLAVLPQKGAQAMACRAGRSQNPEPGWPHSQEHGGGRTAQCFLGCSPPDSILRRRGEYAVSCLRVPSLDPSSTRPGFEAWGKLQASLHSLLAFARNAHNTYNPVAIWVKH